MPGVFIGIGVSIERRLNGAGGVVGPALAQVNSGTSLVATTATSWLSAPTVGNLLVLAVTSSGTFSTPTGWTLDVNASSVKNLGYYIFYRTADGTAADSPSYTQAGNFTSVWNLLEFSGSFTFEESANNTTTATGQTTVSSADITPPAGNYLIVTAFAATSSDVTDDMDFDMVNITNSFTIADHSGFNGITSGSGQDDLTQTIAYKVVTVDGVTVVNSSADTWSAASVPFNNPGSLTLAFTYTT